VESSVLADTVLVVHFAFVLFVVGGFALILLGAALSWAWIRNPVFRYVHLSAIVFVAIEALVGMACPLTAWEAALRHASPEAPSFVGRLVGRMLYYDLPDWVFTLAYVLFALAVAAALRWIPPHRSSSRNPLSF
jgi:Protein of Unknown function (DUF2784)